MWGSFNPQDQDQVKILSKMETFIQPLNDLEKLSSGFVLSLLRFFFYLTKLGI